LIDLVREIVKLGEGVAGLFQLVGGVEFGEKIAVFDARAVFDDGE